MNTEPTIMETVKTEIANNLPCGKADAHPADDGFHHPMKPPTDKKNDTLTPEMRLTDAGFLRDTFPKDFDNIVEGYRLAKETKRGLMLVGKPGCGKFTAMKALYPKAIIVRLYDPSSLAMLMPDSVNGLFERNVSVCLDKLGAESPENRFGTLIDHVGIFIMSFYDRKFRAKAPVRLHVTTHLDERGLLDRYGEAVLSQLNELVVIVPLKSEDHRKRIIVR